MSEERKLKVILSGGGTGGHIYPAVAVAEALGRRLGDRVDVLFVGAEGKMEMEKVPALGYPIVGLPVAGLQRRLTLRNLAVPAKVLASLVKARRVIRRFGADVVVGFGGYASAPVLWSAQRMGIPTLIQEQNSYAGRYEQAARIAGPAHLRSLRGHGALFPRRSDRADGQSAARSLRRFRRTPPR